MASRKRFLGELQRRYGSTFAMTLPPFGPSVFLCSADLTKHLLTTSPAIAGLGRPSLGNVLGPGSMFALDGPEHLRRRKLVVPPFHGRRLRAYEELMVEETIREAETWPQGVEFETAPAFMRLTLNIILRAVLGAEGEHLDRLRDLMPPIAELGAMLTVSPFADRGRSWGAWARYRRMRQEYDELAFDLIDTVKTDPSLEQREDVLAMLVQSRYDDGEPMSDQEIADELLTMLGAGHETTANTLAWAVERVTRHPALLDRLVAEADAGGTELLAATILEVQRTRPVITDISRTVLAPTMSLGQWTIPQGHQIVVAIDFVQMDENVFPEPEKFDPDRFLNARPGTYSWIPFGGGTRRCIGAAFADLEMNLVLRTVLQNYELGTTYAPGEKWKSRGVSWTPARGGRAVVHRRHKARVLSRSKTAAGQRGGTL
ncbi:cytochrome P450 [Streptomyces spongiae]|nr:cytochrome P450 [Streptomyces spongiae]